MAVNGTHGPEANGVSTNPVLDEILKVFRDGAEQTLLSGIKVRLRPADLPTLMQADDLPDMLTPLLIAKLFPAPPAANEKERFPDEVDTFISKPFDERKEALARIQAINYVCMSVLVDPSILPVLDMRDRMWLFKLAFMPAAVLSTFRLESEATVEPVVEGDEVPQAAV